MTHTILVITNFPNKESASALVHALIDKQIAACANIMSSCTSIYRWQDSAETAEEIPVFIKTQQKHYEQVEDMINAMHSYELPEVIAVPIINGLPAYLQWVIDETTPKN